jgi:hypothetical protein
MKQNEVIESYVREVVRRLPARDRDEIGLELQGLLGEMLADREASGKRPADDAMTLAVLQDFGAPAEVAARYRDPAFIAISSEQARSFTVLSSLGIFLQWSLTLPHALDGRGLGGWWFSWGLGAFWLPGLIATIVLPSAWLRSRGFALPNWRPNLVDPERIDRRAKVFGMIWFSVGALILAFLPSIARLLTGPAAEVFAYDAEFLRQRAPPVLALRLADLANRAGVLARGRWSPRAQWTDVGVRASFAALLTWWLAAGRIFSSPATDEGAKAAIGIIIVFAIIGAIRKVPSWRAPARPPHAAG